jgi:imidazolonepropionase-like amidohydrolase
LTNRFNSRSQHLRDVALGILLLSLLTGTLLAQDAKPRPILFTNVHVFDGSSEQLFENASVLVEGKLIKQVSKEAIPADDAMVIDGDGRTLMPGLIDNHWHSMFAAMPQEKLLTSDIGYINLVASKQSRETLLRGFTSVRDVGGPVFGLQQAIDEGLTVGPRIYPSGAYISQTSGHGDFRGKNDVPSQQGRPLTYLERIGVTLVADGRPEVIKRTREVLRMGSTQIKVMAGGGVSSFYDPVDVSQYTIDELQAIVEVAKTWNTYVTVHAFSDDAVRRSVEAGVLCIEHGHMMSEETVRLLAEKKIWLSMQPILNDEDAIPFPEGSFSQQKFIQVTDGTDLVYRMARKHKVKLAWGTDTLFDAELTKKQGKQLVKMVRWFQPHEVLKMATHDNAELLKLSGPRDPYPGKLGVVEQGALADLILVDGNPLENIQLIANPEENFVVIMKDGVIYKNSITR